MQQKLVTQCVSVPWIYSAASSVAFAGNLCLTLGATGGVYVGGGVIEKLIRQASLTKIDF